MGNVERRIRPTVLSLAVQGTSSVTYVPAVRLTEDRAVAILPVDRRLADVNGTAAPAIVTRDAARSLIVVKPDSPGEVVNLPSAPQRPGPRYVAVAEATALASAVRPTFVGRTDFFADPRWPEPVLAVAAVQQTLMPGSAVFSLDGAFIGLASESGGAVTIVPGNMLREFAAAAPSKLQSQGALPIDVEPLSPALARAAGTDKGVMVSFVSPTVPSSSTIASGDVVQAIDGIGITTVEGFEQVAQRKSPGTRATLTVLRRGKPHTVTLAVNEIGFREPWTTPNEHGIVLRSIPAVGAEVIVVQAGSPGERSGLERGDVIVTLDGHQAPDPSRIDRSFAVARAGDVLLLTVRRDTAQRMVALEKQ